MHSCEFCDAGIAVVDGAIIPGSAMMAALEKGYTSNQCPNWPVMSQRMALALERERAESDVPMPPINEEAIRFRWQSLLNTPEKNWRLCNQCFSTLGPYLPPRPVSNGVVEDSLERLQYVLPVNTSIWAILAGYAGLFAVLVVTAPIALLLGIIALWHVNRNKSRRLGGKGRAIFAIVMGSIFTALLVFIGVLCLSG